MIEKAGAPENNGGSHVPDESGESVEKQKLKPKKKRKKKSERRRPDAPPTEAQKKARYKPGQSGNPAGRPKGIPNLNHELREAVIQFKKGDKTYLELLLEKGLRNSKVAAKLLDKIVADATPPAEAAKINNIVQNQQSAMNSEAFKDDTVRDAAAILEERIFGVARGEDDASGNGQGSE